ncbi:MAG: exodeoxyribonuclease VII large subunit [Phycisphaerae bacterium]|nr:exodeoxyribonuclease VII large subunit [Phycisphaerae bacterium]
MESRLKTYTVSQVNALVKAAISDRLPARFIVRAQIRDWKRHSSGHCYFSLKDEKGVLPAVMWSSQMDRVKFEPENGMEILATGSVDVYVPGGKYQFYAEKLEPLGVGALQVAFDQMVAKLRGEGLFDETHKKPLPLYPERIGILTSQTGAAVHDIAESIFDRWPLAELLLFPVPVQGENAALEIAKTLTQVNQANKQYRLDLLIVGRGGGSLEDLWAFNEEILARAIFASKIPVISAVGHEVDVTVADFVADARASTPTRAGVEAVPDQGEVLDQLDHWQKRLAGHVTSCMALSRARLQTVSAAAMFKRPQAVLGTKTQQVDDAMSLLERRMHERLHTQLRRVSHYYDVILRLEPHRLLGKRTHELDQLAGRASAAVAQHMYRSTVQLESSAAHLSGLNPKGVLERGYSITLHAGTGKVIRSIEDVTSGDTLITELAGDQTIHSQVTKTESLSR